MDKSVDRVSNNIFSRWWHRRRSRIEQLSKELVVGDGPYFSSAVPFVILLILALAGTFAAGFLTYRHVLIASSSGTVAESPLCKADGTISCDAILQTEYSVLFGYFPSAVLGLMGFAFVLWFVVNALANQRTRKIACAALVLYFSAAMGFSWYYAYIMAFQVDIVCPWCIVVHIVNLLSIIVVLALAIKNRKKFLLPELATLGERTYLIVGGLLFCVSVFLGATLWEKALSFHDVKAQFESLANDPEVIKAVLVSSLDYKIPVTAGDPVYGSPNAPHQIILFSDFKCPVCAKVEQFLKSLVDKNPTVLSLVFLNYPLSKECNPMILEDLHPGACPTARAAYAAYLIGGSKAFWAFGDLVFAAQKKLTPGMLPSFAKKLGLNEKRFDELMKPDSIAAKKIEQDVKLGTELNLVSTPQIFFERKRIPEMFSGAYLVEAFEGLIAAKNPQNKEIRLER